VRASILTHRSSFIALYYYNDYLHTDLQRLSTKKTKYQDEHTQLSRGKTKGPTRLRKNDVEETRTRADQFAKQRDEANRDPRRGEIQVEISHTENKMDQLKRHIEDDKIALSVARTATEAQSSIVLLKDQYTKDLEALEEIVREQVSTLQKFNLTVPQLAASAEEDETGELMQDAVERLVDQVQRQYEDAHTDVSRATDEISRTQQVVSEKTALLASGQQSLNSLKSKVDRLQRGSVQTFRKVADELRRHETSMGLAVVVADENNSRQLLTYLEERLAAVEEDAPVENASESIKQFVKKLKRQVRRAGLFVCRTNACALTVLFS
jgi:chromosome segregation ATPase